MAKKVMSFVDKVKKIKRKDVVCFSTDDGEVIEFQVESRSQADIDKVNQKYDELEPPVPTKRLPSAKGKMKIVENPDDPEYKAKVTEIRKRNFAELALLFLSEHERPEGEVEEQVNQIMNVELAGFVSKITQRGFELSGIIDEGDLEEEIEEAKND